MTGLKASHQSAEGLWIDRSDAADQLERRLRDGVLDESTHSRVQQFMTNGYAILEQAVDHDIIDNILRDVDRIAEAPEYYVERRTRTGYCHPDPNGFDRQSRVIELYVNSSAAREAMFAPDVISLLRAIFEDDPQAFQSLYFQYGSQQAIHQDTAYVVADPPTSIAAAWIALEDVHPGAGELTYYEGSHRNPHYYFSGERRSWNPQKDGQDQHKEFLDRLHSDSQERGLAFRSFLPNKGDVFMWHADLAHGGAKITDPDRTRKSLVVHFCPAWATPKYFTFTPFTHVERHSSGGLYSARHYDLRDPGQPLLPRFMGNSVRRTVWQLDKRSTITPQERAAESTGASDGRRPLLSLLRRLFRTSAASRSLTFDLSGYARAPRGILSATIKASEPGRLRVRVSDRHGKFPLMAAADPSSETGKKRIEAEDYPLETGTNHIEAELRWKRYADDNKLIEISVSGAGHGYTIEDAHVMEII